MYWLESDTFAEEPEWAVLSGGSPAREDALQAAYCRLNSTAAHLRSDGFLTEAQALRQCRGRRALLAQLAARVLADRAPKLHQAGDECDCLDGVEWRAGYQYMIHAFLKRNPSKAENRRHKAQQADLRDARLKQQVYEHDGGCCRYCRSGPLPRKGMGRARDRRKVIQFDHVDPDLPAGEDATNLVVACARCNEYKGHRTPAEADMILLPPPTEAETATWAARGLALFDRPESTSTTDTTTDGQPTGQRDDALSDALSTTSDPVAPPDDPQAVSAGELCPETAQPPADPDATTHATTAGEGHGSGRVGQPVRAFVDHLGQPSRGPESPDVYHRRSRDPTRAPPHLRDPPPLDEHLPEGEP